MTDISDLRSSLDALRKAGTINATSYTSLVTKLNSTEAEFQSIQKEALAYKESSDRLLLEKLTLEQEKSTLAAQVTKLSNEKAELESRISVLQKSRPALSSSNLVSSFASSLAEMDTGLKKVQSGPRYSVSSMNVTLKTNIALEGEELRFQMPKADDILSPGNLSTIEFSLRAAPGKPGIESYREVPDLTGLPKEDAENKLLEAGFRAGEVLEKESRMPQGTVTAQLPSGGSLAEPGAAVDLTVSKVLSVKVPDLTGLALDDAKTLLEKSRLRLEQVKEKPSNKTPGTVLAQSLGPGSETEVNSSIVLTVSVQTFKVPNLLGLELESAKQVIEKSGLRQGDIKKQPSGGKPGIVLAQSLKPGLEVEANSKVDLVVSAGEKQVEPENPVRPFPGTAVKDQISRTELASKTETVNKGKSVILSKLQPETTSGKPGENTAGISAASVSVTGAPAETQVKISPEAQVKISTETQTEVRTQAQVEPSVKSPARVESPVESSVKNSVDSSIKSSVDNSVKSSVDISANSSKDGAADNSAKTLNEKTLSGKTTPMRVILDPIPLNTITPNTAILDTITPNTVTLNTASPIAAAPAQDAAAQNSAASLKTGSVVIPEPKTQLVPDVTGMALEKAISFLGARGIKAGTVSEAVSTVVAGTVISQKPGAGSVVDLSVPVNLMVSKQAPEIQLRASTFARLKI